MSIAELDLRVNELERELSDMKRMLDGAFSALKKFTSEDQENELSLAIKEQDPATLNLDIDLSCSKAVAVRYKDRMSISGDHLMHMKIPTVVLDAKLVSIEGDLVAKLNYSSPMIWRVGQERLQLYSANRGFPVIIQQVGRSNTESDAQVYKRTGLYIDPEDNYWYLNGEEGIQMITVIFVGKI